MATRAARILAMLLHELAQRQRLAIGSAVFQTRNIRRRRWWRRAQHVLQQPLAPQNYGRSVGIRGYGQETALTQEPAARIQFRAERHTPKVAAVNVRNSVMTGQTFVKKRIVCIQ